MNPVTAMWVQTKILWRFDHENGVFGYNMETNWHFQNIDEWPLPRIEVSGGDG